MYVGTVFGNPAAARHLMVDRDTTFAICNNSNVRPQGLIDIEETRPPGEGEGWCSTCVLMSGWR